MKRQDDQSEVADSKSSFENTPPQPFNLFAGLESEQLQPAEPSVIQQQQKQISQIADPSIASAPQSPAKLNRSLLIATVVVAALIIGVLIGYGLFRH